MGEIWKIVPFAPKYQASDLGRLIGKRNKIMNPTLTDRGYFVCDLNLIQYRVNRIICITFNGEPPSIEHQAAHKDSDSSNNRADNLYWATSLQNACDLAKTGRNNGENSGAALLKESEVLEIRRMHLTGMRMARIVEHFPKVTYPTISAIVHRRSWKHLP